MILPRWLPGFTLALAAPAGTAIAQIVPLEQIRTVHSNARYANFTPPGYTIDDDGMASPDFLRFNQVVSSQLQGNQITASSSQDSSILGDRLTGLLAGTTHVQGYPLFASASSTSAFSVLFQLNVPTQFRLQGNGTVAGSTTGGAPHELEGTAVLRLTDNSSQVLQETSTSMNGSPASLDVLLTLGPGTYRLFANVDLYSSTQVGERSDGSGQLSFALTAIPAPPAAGAVLALVLAVRRRRARRA